MSTTVISIGRNLPTGGELELGEWLAFRADVLVSVRNLGGTLFFAGEGNGIYEGETETSFTVIADIPYVANHLGALRAQLAPLASAYGQDAIAVTVGATTFVGGTVDV